MSSKSTVTVCIAKSTGAVRVITNVTCKPLLETKQVWQVSGTQGPAGPRGAKGVAGDRGSQGIQGPMGPKGEKGESGPIGPDGVVGEKGERGAPGLSYKDVLASISNPDAEYQQTQLAYASCNGPNWQSATNSGNNTTTCFLSLAGYSRLEITEVSTYRPTKVKVEIMDALCSSAGPVRNVWIWQGMSPVSIDLQTESCLRIERKMDEAYGTSLSSLATEIALQASTPVGFIYSIGN